MRCYCDHDRDTSTEHSHDYRDASTLFDNEHDINADVLYDECATSSVYGHQCYLSLRKRIPVPIRRQLRMGVLNERRDPDSHRAMSQLASVPFS